MGEIYDKVKALAEANPDYGYLNELDLVQNMRRMTALAQQMVVEFNNVEPSMTTIYELRDEYESLEERTITIVNNYEGQIEENNQEFQIIINNLREQADSILQNIDELLNIGENFNSIAEQINTLLQTNDTVVQMTQEINNLEQQLGIEEITPGTDSWVEPVDRVRGKLYAEVRSEMVTDRDPVTRTEADPTVADHQGPTVDGFKSSPVDGGLFKFGDLQTIASINATVNARGSHKVARAILYDGNEVLAIYDWSKNNPALGTATVSFTPTGVISTVIDKQFKLRVFDETGAADEYFAKPFEFIHPFYHGSLPASTQEVTVQGIKTRIDGGFISPTIMKKPTETTNFIFNYESGTDIILYPAEYGDLESMITISGDEINQHTKVTLDDFEIEGVPYIAYFTSGGAFSQSNQQMQIKFPDPEPEPPKGSAKIKPLAFGYIPNDTVQITTGVEVTITEASALIKEIRVYDGNKLVANQNSDNGLAGEFKTGTTTLSWDTVKTTGQKSYTIEVEDMDGRTTKFESSTIAFIDTTYFGLIYQNDANQVNLPMEDSALRKVLHLALPKMIQMFPKPTWHIKESHGAVKVTGDNPMVHDLICFPTSYGQVTRITDGDGANRLTDYRTQRVNLNGMDLYVMVGPAPTASVGGNETGVYNRTFYFK